jgi:hypothetical protein
VQQADHEGPAIRPTRASLEVGENVFGIVTAVLCNDASEGPEDGSGLIKS